MKQLATLLSRSGSRYRIVWLLLVTASAVAITNYLFDPNSQPLTGWTIFGLIAASWVTVIVAWRRHRPYLRRWSGGLTFCVVVLEIIFVSIARNALFACPPLPPTAEELHKSALIAAVDANDLASVQAALVYINDPDDVNPASHNFEGDYDYHERPLETAIGKGNLQIAALLIDHGASVTMDEPPPLSRAASRGDVPMMRLLLHHGATADCGDSTGSPLRNAVQSGNADAVSLLLHCGANPNETWIDGDQTWTVLHLARSLDNIPVAKALIHAGATE